MEKTKFKFQLRMDNQQPQVDKTQAASPQILFRHIPLAPRKMKKNNFSQKKQKVYVSQFLHITLQTFSKFIVPSFEIQPGSLESLGLQK